MLNFKKVLVTGATGFIGGRLVEKLILDHKVEVRALVRNFSKAARIARFDLEMIGGEVSDAQAVDRAVAGCDVVFHCAHDFSGRQGNLDGAGAIAEACLKHQVRRLVHTSSISVYEPLSDGDLDESARREPCGWDYPDTKRAVDELLLEFHAKRSLPVVFLQPAIVYGPFSNPWTLTPIKQLRSGRIVLPDAGQGLCNAVYVDDVVDAMLLAAEREEAVGESMLVSAETPVTWRQFYAAYEKMLGIEGVVLVPAEEIRKSAGGKPGKPPSLKTLGKDPLRITKWGPTRALYEILRSPLVERYWMKMRRRLPQLMYLPNEQQLALYGAQARVKIDKAKRLLGYQPKFDFDRGMKLTKQYVQWANL